MKESMMKIQFIIGILILLLATCSAQPKEKTSGAEGRVFTGPMCPVMQEGQACPNQPYRATLTVNSLKGEKIALEPGEYILHPESPNAMPFAGEQIFSVGPGRLTPLTVTYDSGIR
jgi:hypothetical protein